MNQPRHRRLKQLFLQLFPVSVEGLHNVPQKGGVILATNHNSPLDGVFVWACLRRDIFFLVIDLAFRGVVGLVLSWTGQIPASQNDRFSRCNPWSGAMALRDAEHVLACGGAVGINPEGQCNKYGRMSRFWLGVVRIALATGTPVVPAGIRGSDRVMPNMRSIPRPFRPVQVVIGEPIEVTGRANTQENRRWLLAQLEQAISELSVQHPSSCLCTSLCSGSVS